MLWQQTICQVHVCFSETNGAVSCGPPSACCILYSCVPCSINVTLFVDVRPAIWPDVPVPVELQFFNMKGLSTTSSGCCFWMFLVWFYVAGV